MANLNWGKYSPVVTTNLVVNETYTLMVFRSKGNVNLLSPLHDLFWGEDNFFRIVTLTNEDFIEISQLLSKYVSRRKMISFVDASLIYLGVKLNYKEIITFDAHFDGILSNIAMTG